MATINRVKNFLAALRVTTSHTFTTFFLAFKGTSGILDTRIHDKLSLDYYKGTGLGTKLMVSHFVYLKYVIKDSCYFS